MDNVQQLAPIAAASQNLTDLFRPKISRPWKFHPNQFACFWVTFCANRVTHYRSRILRCHLWALSLLLTCGCWSVEAVHVGSAVAQVGSAVRWQVPVSDGNRRWDWDGLPDSAGDNQSLPGRLQTVWPTWSTQCRGCPASRARRRRLLGHLQLASLLRVRRRRTPGASSVTWQSLHEQFQWNFAVAPARLLVSGTQMNEQQQLTIAKGHCNKLLIRLSPRPPEQCWLRSTHPAAGASCRSSIYLHQKFYVS